MRDCAAGCAGRRRLSVSVPLALSGLLLGLIIAIPVGTYAARNVGRPSGALLALLSQIGVAVPVFWAGILLSVLFGVRLGWLPTGGWTDYLTVELDAVELGPGAHRLSVHGDKESGPLMKLRAIELAPVR